MVEPNPDKPLEADIAQVYKENIEKFRETAKAWTEKYAS